MKNKLKVALRGGFSDRNGIKRENTTIQYKELDNRTRIAICNYLSLISQKAFSGDFYYEKSNIFWTNIFSEVYQQQVNYSSGINYDNEKCLEIVKTTIMEDEYDDVLTVLEYFIHKIEEVEFSNKRYEKGMNDLFEKEYVGYRFVKGIITSITDSNEINSINTAIEIEYENVSNHLIKALEKISDRNSPDYANSIKESISAVESMCNNYLKVSKGTLGEMLNKIETSGISIHPALKKSFQSLYGYTSDASGIRHGEKLGDESATFEEAEFMLVACSAFVNYLKGNMSKIK